MTHVMFATDGSPAAEHAIREASRLLTLKGAKATVITVDDLTLGVPDAQEAQGVESILHVRDAARRADDLARAAALLAASGATIATAEREGDAATRIAEAAVELGADVVVVCTRGHGPLRRAILGSVSTALLHGEPKHDWHGAVMVIGQPEA